jgi:cell division protein FtsZ
MAPAQIKVIGVGGAGVNTARRMMQQGRVPGVEYIAVNTDIEALGSFSGSAALSIQIGEHLTRGLSAGGDVRIGERAAEESRHLLKRAVKDAELVFVTVGMGGGTGTGAAPVIAEVAKESGAMTIAVVTMPFSFEGGRRLEIALSGLRRLVSKVNNIIIVPNDRLLQFGDHNVPVDEAFTMVDDVVAEGILSVSQLINVPGEINVDLADVKTVMSIPGGALMAIGQGDGARYPALEAAEQAISNSLLDINVKGAKGVLINFSGGPELALGEVNEALNLIARQADPNAIIFFGVSFPDDKLKDKVKLTVVATGIRSPTNGGWFSKIGQNLRSAMHV